MSEQPTQGQTVPLEPVVEPSRFHTQTKFGVGPDVPPHEQGDCTECAVATLLGIPRADVPCLHGEDGAAGFWDRLDEFFAARGLYLHRFDGTWTFPCLYLAGGRTARGTNHMVVMRDGELFHDPHPDGTGLAEMRHAFVAAPMDPAITARPNASGEPPLCNNGDNHE